MFNMKGHAVNPLWIRPCGVLRFLSVLTYTTRLSITNRRQVINAQK